MQAEEIIKHFVKTTAGADCALTKLTGDASDRAYYRAAAESGSFGGRGTAVVMHMQPSENEPPFITVGRMLSSAGVPVPSVLGADLPRGLILLEDLGDVTLMESIAEADVAEKRRLYFEALDVMIGIQLRGTEMRGNIDCPCFTLAFDIEKLMFEFDFFIQNALKIWKQVEFRRGREAEIRGEFLTISEILSDEPRFVCHRDYHSRNLMVTDGRLRVIDFQDARMGPLQYDLASLLCDSYVDLPPYLIQELYDAYPVRLAAAGGPHLEPDRFDYIYDIMVVQRNIKAAGSFAYLDCVKNMNRYLSRMGECMSHVRAAFDRRPELSGLRAMLSEYFPELSR